MGSLIFKEDLTAIKQLFAFIAYKRHCKHIKGKSSKIGLAVVLLLPVLNDIKMFKIFNFKNIYIKVLLWAINGKSHVFGINLINYFTTIMSSKQKYKSLKLAI